MGSVACQCLPPATIERLSCDCHPAACVRVVAQAGPWGTVAAGAALCVATQHGRAAAGVSA